ncbi:hypothetical protein [Phaeobacter sp.]|uniref:hypothetical protein n=1 Tax=Phaeobacter sp. TaxID=1902409 RepID=UPI0025D68DAD|nr:hypothetical protein [Phaeobacter sp.]
MAWVGIAIGTLLGMVHLVASPALYDMPTWLAIGLYPVVGTFGSILTMVVLMSLRAPPKRPQSVS